MTTPRHHPPQAGHHRHPASHRHPGTPPRRGLRGAREQAGRGRKPNVRNLLKDSEGRYVPGALFDWELDQELADPQTDTGRRTALAAELATRQFHEARLRGANNSKKEPEVLMSMYLPGDDTQLTPALLADLLASDADEDDDDRERQPAGPPGEQSPPAPPLCAPNPPCKPGM
jgi:hypothetical protein